MARTQISKAIKDKILSGLKRGKKPVDLARMNKVSVGYVYKLRSVEANSTNSDNSATIATPVVETVEAVETVETVETVAAVESAPVAQAPVVQPTTVQIINAEISTRENEIAVLKNTLDILYK